VSVVGVLVALLSGFVGGVAVWAAARYVLKSPRPEAVGVPVGVGIAVARLFETAGWGG